MNCRKILKYSYPIVVILIGFVLSYISVSSWMNMAYTAAVQICVILLLIAVGYIIYKKPGRSQSQK